jgi:hypothetical protein
VQLWLHAVLVDPTLSLLTSCRIIDTVRFPSISAVNSLIRRPVIGFSDCRIEYAEVQSVSRT